MREQELLEAIGCHPLLSQDMELREALKKQPHQTITQLLPEWNISPSINIQIHENTSSEMHLILLSEEENVEEFTFDTDDALEIVLEKALSNEDFRLQLLKNPYKVLTEELPNFYIPEDFKVFFHENQSTQIHLLLPPLEDEPTGELSEDELHEVTGGAPHEKGRRRKGPHVGRRRGQRRAPRCRKRLFFR